MVIAFTVMYTITLICNQHISSLKLGNFTLCQSVFNQHISSLKLGNFTRQVCGFARVLRFPPPIKLTARIFEIGAKHHPLNPYNFVCYKADESINEELEAASVIKRRVNIF
jgi:hypothetical protein